MPWTAPYEKGRIPAGEETDFTDRAIADHISSDEAPIVVSVTVNKMRNHDRESIDESEVAAADAPYRLGRFVALYHSTEDHSSSDSGAPLVFRIDGGKCEADCRRGFGRQYDRGRRQ